MAIKLERYNWPELDEACSNYQYHSPMVVNDNLWAWHLYDAAPRQVDEPYLVHLFNEGISTVRQRSRRFQQRLIAVLAISLCAIVAFGWYTQSLTGMAFLYQPLPDHLHPWVTVMRILVGVGFGLFLVSIPANWFLIRNNVSGQYRRERLIALLAFSSLAVAIDISGFIVTTIAG